MGRKSFVFEVIKKWRESNPEKIKIDCKKELNLSFPTINKYWNLCGITALTPREKVEIWCKEHPDGSFAWCVEDTNLNFRTVKKYWTLDLK